MSEQSTPPPPPVRTEPATGAALLAEWRTPLLLLVLTALSTLTTGALQHGVEVGGIGELFALPFTRPLDLLRGWDFALPLMAILFAHEMGHYIAARLHRIDVSPPYFIPMPLTLFGTMGAVIRMRGRIESRRALLDVGAAGPLAGMVVALPVLVYGIATSPVTPLPAAGTFIMEGRSVLYLAILYALKGPIPAGHDVFLTPTAFAGWAGLLVTMINLLPIGQLDGGHVAYALLGRRQNALARRLWSVLPLLAIGVGAWFTTEAWLAGVRGAALFVPMQAGIHWADG